MNVDGIEDMSIVGNGATLTDMELGDEIDSRKCVARFNNYVISDDYVRSTGKREDIWITSFCTDIERKDVEYKNVLCPFPLFDPMCDMYLRNEDMIRQYDVEFIPLDVFADLLQMIQKPSTGMAFLYWYYRVVGSIRKSQVYGFSFFSGRHHYFDDFRRCNHDGISEKALFEKMVEGTV